MPAQERVQVPGREQVLERFYRRGETDSADLLEAIRFEQGYASPEGHAALYCLAGWIREQESIIA